VIDALRNDRARLDDIARRAREMGAVSRSGRLAELIDAVADGDP